MESIETTFEHWRIDWEAGPQVALHWQVARRYDRECLAVCLLADGESFAAPTLAEVYAFAGGQVEVTAHLPLTVYADPRAAILSLELAALFVVQDGVLSVEPG